jgi:hypothetical protein
MNRNASSGKRDTVEVGAPTIPESGYAILEGGSTIPVSGPVRKQESACVWVSRDVQAGVCRVTCLSCDVCVV